jgi:UDP-glucose 4-epimerase
MRILITGATGFLGSYLAADLIEAGHEVSVFVRPNSDSWRLEGFEHRLRFVDGRLEDEDSVRSALMQVRPQAIAHLAWSGVGNVDRNRPIQAQNVPLTVTLADMAAEFGVEAFVGAGSQAEYGPHQSIIREDTNTRPTTLYGHAKLAAGNMVLHLARDRRMRCVWMRIFSTYGPKDADYWLIPSMIRTLQRGQRMQLTACEQRWSFLHAKDAAAAFRLALTNSRASGIYNVGSAKAPLLRETVIALRDMVAPGAELGFGELPYRSDQVMILQPDVQRLASLGWRENISLTDGLVETAEWYNAKH